MHSNIWTAFHLLKIISAYTEKEITLTMVYCSNKFQSILNRKNTSFWLDDNFICFIWVPFLRKYAFNNGNEFHCFFFSIASKVLCVSLCLRGAILQMETRFFCVEIIIIIRLTRSSHRDKILCATRMWRMEINLNGLFWLNQTEILIFFFLLFFFHNLFAVDFINPKISVSKRTLSWATQTQNEK